MRIVTLVLCVLSSLSAAHAQDRVQRPHAFWHRPLPPPALMVRRNDRSQAMQITKLAINARIVGHLAETTMTMTFYNPNPATLEGDLYFPLPEGAAVSGYALDIHGVMVDGVIVDKQRGRQVFETEVRKGIDPGLVEWTKGSNFKTRVFPIPPHGTRTIRVSVVSEVERIGGHATYYLPLGFRQRIAQLSLRIEVVKAAAEPVVVRGGPGELRFSYWRDSFVTQAWRTNIKLDKDLYLRLPRADEHPVRVERARDGKVYFALRYRPRPDEKRAPAVAPRRIALYWDTSLSRERADHQSELKLLEAYLDRLGQAPVTVDVVLFANTAERPRQFSLPAQRAALLSMLRQVRYDGATQIGALPRLPGTNLILLFSDGVSNFGPEDPRALEAPVYAINSASTASHDLLRYLALRTGGAYFNLRRVAPSQAAQQIGAPAFSYLPPRQLGKGDPKGLQGIYPNMPTPVHGHVDVVGILRGERATLTLRCGYGKRATQQQRFVISRKDAVPGDLLRRAWAQKKVDELMIFPERNAEQIAEVGRRHGIVTAETSLIVLETLSQYLEHQIRPPAGLKQMCVEYDRQIAQRRQTRAQQQRSKLQHVLKLWEQRVAWWGTRFSYPKNYRVAVAKGKQAEREARRPRMRRSAPSAANLLSGAARDAQPAPAAEAKAKPKKAAAARPQPSITIKAWDPNTPYLAAIKAAPARQRYAVYLAQRKTHGAAPAFYLDCAHFFRRAGQKALALRILSNLAELELENAALLRVLAHRLAQVGELDLSVQLFDAARRLRPEEPQSYRDLALVLERRADERRRRRNGRALAGRDYARALKLLAKVVMERWQRFDEIEVIALTELNNILPKARSVGVEQVPVDPRLVKHLDMDIRIVMTWDADNTDMDLHVVEPSGEEAYYGHNRTRIGGLVSRDFTRGYGPEVYAIRRAMRGRYSVRTKFFGSSAAKLAGAVTLQVDVYTNYGRRNQRRRSLTLRLTEKKESFEVGSIAF